MLVCRISISIALQGEVGPPGRQGIKGDAGAKVSKHWIFFMVLIINASSDYLSMLPCSCFLKGQKGAPGLPGATGAAGLRGPKGLPGHIGEKGIRGQQGEKGITGQDGEDVSE